LINQNLHKQPAALDLNTHRNVKLQLPVTDWSVAKELNAVFLATVEFGDACLDYPIVFVRAGKDDDGSDSIAPIALMGLRQGDNLFIQGPQWRGGYMPAVMRMYPFCIARMNEQRYAVCIDIAFPGTSQTEGTPLFTAEGKPAELVVEMQRQLELLEQEIQRTRLICKRLRELDLLQDMRFEATLPDGSKHAVDGFMTLDDAKVTALPDATVVELHRNGMLGLMHLHWASMGQMRKMVQLHAQRVATEPAVVAPAVPAAPGALANGVDAANDAPGG